MRRKRQRPQPRLKPGSFDHVAIVIAADSPQLLMERVGQWCDAETGLLPRAQRGGRETPSHSLAIHIAPGRQGKAPRFVAVLTPIAGGD